MKITNLKDLQKNIANKNVATKHSPIIDDLFLKGGYRVVRTVKERNSIDCCYRKIGMRVMVIGQDDSFKDYILTGNNPCSNDNWTIITGEGTTVGPINDADINLINDFSSLDPDGEIVTQQDLNLVLQDLIIILMGASTTTRDKNWVYDQAIPSALWTINHPLDKIVSVTITDTAGTEVEGKILTNDGLKVVIQFNYPFSGSASLN